MEYKNPVETPSVQLLLPRFITQRNFPSRATLFFPIFPIPNNLFPSQPSTRKTKSRLIMLNSKDTNAKPHYPSCKLLPNPHIAHCQNLHQLILWSLDFSNNLISTFLCNIVRDTIDVFNDIIKGRHRRTFIERNAKL
jgi:hypothetical protein